MVWTSWHASARGSEPAIWQRWPRAGKRITSRIHVVCHHLKQSSAHDPIITVNPNNKEQTRQVNLIQSNLFDRRKLASGNSDPVSVPPRSREGANGILAWYCVLFKTMIKGSECLGISLWLCSCTVASRPRILTCYKSDIPSARHCRSMSIDPLQNDSWLHS